MRVYIIYHSYSDQSLQYLPFSVWSGSTPFAILSSLIKVYTICHSQQSDQGQGPHSHSLELSGHGLHYFSFSKVWSGFTLFAVLSSLIRVYSVCHFQQSDQGQGPLSFSGTVWSESTMFSILSSLIRICTVYHSQQCDHRLHCLTFSAVWSRCTLFTILSSLIRVYTICPSQQSDRGLHCLPFPAIWSVSTVFAILGHLIRVYSFCHSQQSNQGLQFLPFSAV